MSINLSALMKQRFDTAANWTAQNTTLLAGEIGIESDTKKWKVGDGTTAWTSLVYAIGGTYPIVNADIAAAAAIAYSKLATLTSGNIVLGSAANVATSTAVTGDVTISNTGVTAIAAGVIVNADINASAGIVDTKLATIATAGKVSNSATTAASANTASAIVARDASGNFTAGTITAALTGAASSNVLKAGDTMTGVLAVTAGTAALPGIAVSGDLNTGLFSPGADTLALVTGGTNRVHVTSGGLVGIGTTGPLSVFDCVVGASGARRLLINYDDSVITVKGSSEVSNPEALRLVADNIRFNIGTTGSGTEKARLDSSGRLLVGTSTAAGNGLLQIVGDATSSNGNPLITLRRDVALASLGDGSGLGKIVFTCTDGGVAAEIAAVCEAPAGTNDYPGRLVFSTTADGASSPTERMRITNAGAVGIGGNNGGEVYNSSTTNGFYFAETGGLQICRNEVVAFLNRRASDGTIVSLRQDGTEEGAISVSGTTITYGGGHLARWSQLPNDEDPSALLKGTVMSNLDEMCEWGDEDNEQLNKTKVSDVEGDANVAGVFVSTSFSDDGPLDYFVAMTGDMIIRIAEGVTVQRGDLLMSAGDGTAKPQDDDIIRSKTVAKVTSTHVTCTYEDGSYCVPCVLMAC